MKKHDYLIIGSSPISLMTSIELSKKGYSVAIIEKKKEMGGSWASTNVFGYKGVDQGPHVIHGNIRTFSYLKKEFNINIFYYRDKNYCLNTKKIRKGHVLNSAKTHLRALKHLALNPLKKGILRGFWQFFYNLSLLFVSPFFYKSGHAVLGCKELIEKISAHKEMKKICFLREEECKRIEISKNTCIIETKKKSYFADKIIAPSGFEFEYKNVFKNLDLDNTNLRINKIDNSSIFFMVENLSKRYDFLLLESKKKKKEANISNDDRKLKTYADITRIVKKNNPAFNDKKYSVVTVCIERKFFSAKNGKINFSKVFSLLKSKNLVNSEANYIIAEEKTYEGVLSESTCLNRYFSPKVEFISTGSLGGSIDHLLLRKKNTPEANAG